MNINNLWDIPDIYNIRAALNDFITVPKNLVISADVALPQQSKNTFLDVLPGDILYQVVETKKTIEIVDRKVLSVEHTNKKIHLHLEPKFNLLSVDYYPYSNKTFTMSKKLQPLFIKFVDALLWLDDKLYKDAEYYALRLNCVEEKQRYIDKLLRRYNTLPLRSTNIRDDYF